MTRSVTYSTTLKLSSFTNIVTSKNFSYKQKTQNILIFTMLMYETTFIVSCRHSNILNTKNNWEKAINETTKCVNNQLQLSTSANEQAGRTRLGDETSASEQKGVMRQTGIKLWTSDQSDGKLQNFQHAHWQRAVESLIFLYVQKVEIERKKLKSVKFPPQVS